MVGLTSVGEWWSLPRLFPTKADPILTYVIALIGDLYEIIRTKE